MSWAVGYDSNWKRDIGYGVPATCDRPGCAAAIDRGLSYVCGSEPPVRNERGCGLFFCETHLSGRRSVEGHYVFVCGRCDKGRPPYEPTPDVREWIEWKLADDSWGPWREENPGLVEVMRHGLAQADSR